MKFLEFVCIVDFVQMSFFCDKLIFKLCEVFNECSIILNMICMYVSNFSVVFDGFGIINGVLDVFDGVVIFQCDF